MFAAGSLRIHHVRYFPKASIAGAQEPLFVSPPTFILAMSYLGMDTLETLPQNALSCDNEKSLSSHELAPIWKSLFETLRVLKMI